MVNRMIVLLSAATLLTIAAAVALVLHFNRFEESLNSVEHAEDVLRKISLVDVAMHRAELDARSWALSGDLVYLEGYRKSATDLASALGALEDLITSDRGQLVRFEALRSLVDARMAAIAKDTQMTPPQPETGLDRASLSAAQLDETLDAIKRVETTYLAESKANAHRAAFNTTVSASVMAVLAVMASSFGAYWLHREHTRTKIRSAQAHVEAILDGVPDAVVSCDSEGIIVSFSATAEQMFQLTPEEARNRRIASLFVERPGQEFWGLESPGREPQKWTMREVVARRNDGQVFPAEVHLRRMNLEDSVLFVVFIRDLSERRARERHAEELQNDLLHVSRVISMGEMASALAHELNQPLTALAAYLEGGRHLLADIDGARAAIVRDALHKAAGQALRAGGVIRRLREFVSRGETEKGIESLKRMVQEAFALAILAHKEEEVKLNLALDPAVDLVLANRIQIQQVLLNVIRNGLEAMREVSRRELTIASSAAGEGMVLVTIADTGCGIPPEVAGTLFRSFVTTKKDGLGVGLSISRTIIEAHGGKMAAESLSRGGTIFRFSLRSGLMNDE